MPKNLRKSLQRYFSKIKTQHSHQLRLPSKKWISLKSCKHPRTPSFSIENKNNKDDEATLADIDQFLFENFKSLFLDEHEDAHINQNTKSVVRSDEDEEKDEEKTGENKSSKLGRIIFDSSEGGSPLDLNGSNRFFTPRGFSGSTTTSTTNTFEETGSSSNSSTSKTFNINSSSKEDKMNIPNNCVVVLANSPNPYDDFRKSMQENVEARIMKNQSVDWDFMEELLFCYINMNEKKSCKFILSAFCDLISVMRQSSDTESEKDPEKPRSVRTIRKGKDVRKKKNKELTL
ncbi:transcription repressor OFP14-like [Vicia villosa]|uniref:transcription repressor OFP14-like n=1 Tax=Vicia villosa TaxID=3911 RepID=UPI00273C5E30|nr:transcription repressor OFP14-like [Vicia villosa]